ncbi:MAG: DUF222 domain-containing protein [Ilumatobacter sp.]|nr:DUF222 domain-containing protein [Ilumatobacter sp.]
MAVVDTPAQALRSVLRGDVDVLDASEVAVELGQLKAARGVIDSYEVKLTNRLRVLNASGASLPPSDVHARSGGVSAKEAAAKERRAKALDDAPAVGSKLDDGTITSDHVDALANATSRLDDETRSAFFDHDDDLAADAARMTPEEFARSCRDLIREVERDQGIERDRQQRRQTRLSKKIEADGMYSLHGRFHPELGHAIFTALDAETAKLVKAGGDRSVDRQAVAAEALGNLVSGGHQATRPRDAELGLLVDARTIESGPHADSVCEYTDGTPAPLPHVRRFLCNGLIHPIVIDSNGVVLDAGSGQRLANRAQRRALRAMYPTCAFPGCDTTFTMCEVHHLLPFEHGGPTDLANLIPLCSRHHHVVHDQGLELALDDDRTLTITAPDGSTIVMPVPGRQPADPITHERAPAGPNERDGHPPPTVGRPPDPPPGSIDDDRQLRLIA